MKKIKLLVILAVLGLYVTTIEGAFNQKNGVRSAGMGNAFTAVADDVTGMSWNPAGLARTTTEVSFSNADLMGLGLTYSLYAGAIDFKGNSFGVLCSEVKDTILPYKEQMVTVGVGKKIRELGLGVSFDFYKLASYENAQGQGFNVGMLYEKKLGFGYLSLGGAMKNILNRLKYTTGTIESLKTKLVLGMAYVLPNESILAIDITDDELNLGYEYILSNNFSCRAGLNNGKFTSGFTVGMKGWYCDYAFLMRDLGNESRLSVGVKF